jgi:hypothetical protein
VTDTPDICPERLGPVDIASLDDREVPAALLLLAGHEDQAVVGAVVDAVRRVVARTRGR